MLAHKYIHRLLRCLKKNTKCFRSLDHFYLSYFTPQKKINHNRGIQSILDIKPWIFFKSSSESVRKEFCCVTLDNSLTSIVRKRQITRGDFGQKWFESLSVSRNKRHTIYLKFWQEFPSKNDVWVVARNKRKIISHSPIFPRTKAPEWPLHYKICKQSKRAKPKKKWVIYSVFREKKQR